MKKVGRNDLCPCGSGKKFKRCHGGVDAAKKGGPPGPTDEQLQAIVERHKTQEFQRQRQQGRGRPIISSEMNGTRYVAVGNVLAYGKWKTFEDFLLHHLKNRMGLEWGRGESAKNESDQHPLIRWLAVLGEVMKQHNANNSADVVSMPECGASRAVLGLAYDLYLIEHHAQNEADKRAFARLLERLRHPDQFFGARHEASAAGILLRAGFDLTWEEEHIRQAGGHGEFIATFPQTGRSFWVECRMRQPDQDGPGKFTHLVSGALRKQTDLERLIFVELNLPDGHFQADVGGWPGWAVNQLRLLEGQPNAADLPPATILISNLSAHHHLDSPFEGAGAVLEGFKMDRYRLGEVQYLHIAIEEREKNPEIESLWRSLQEHSSIPSTFDGSIPGLDESKRLLIGEKYELPSGVVGVLEDALVVPEQRQVTAFLRLPNGESVMCTFDLSDEELEGWRRHPETFFGSLRPHHPEAKTPLDMYDFFIAGYSETPKERLLEFMASHPDIAELRELPQSELVKRYAYRSAASVAQRSGPPVGPAWYGRLRRRRKLAEQL